VAAGTQNQALNASAFLYTQVLGMDLGDLGEFLLASKRRRVPVGLSKAETQRLLSALTGTWQLMAQTLYGTGAHRHRCLGYFRASSDLILG